MRTLPAPTSAASATVDATVSIVRGRSRNAGACSSAPAARMARYTSGSNESSATASPTARSPNGARGAEAPRARLATGPSTGSGIVLIAALQDVDLLEELERPLEVRKVGQVDVRRVDVLERHE